MKALYLITSLLVFSSSSQAQIIINKIDFSKAESIAKIIKGVNTIRGTQSVVLQLDKSQNIKFVDASNYDHLDPVSIYINSKGDVYINKNEEIKDREHFLKTLKEFSALSKSLNIKTFPIMLTFHDNISGSAGHQVLRDLSNNHFEIIIQREETIQERDLRIKQRAKAKKPSSPK